MKEKSQQLHEVIVHIALLLLHTDDVWGVEGLALVHLNVLVEWEEAKLEEVFNHNGDLGKNWKKETNQLKLIIIKQRYILVI